MSRFRKKPKARSKRPYSLPNLEFLETRLAPALASTSSAVQFDPQALPPGFTGNGVASIRLEGVVDLIVQQKQAFANFEAVADGIALTGGEGEAHLKLERVGAVNLDAAANDLFLRLGADVLLKRAAGHKELLSFQLAGSAECKLNGVGAEAKIDIDGLAKLKLDGIEGSSSVSSLKIEHVADLKLEGSETQADLKIEGADGLNWTLGENVADANVQSQVSLTQGDIGPSAITKITLGYLLPPIMNQGPSQGTAASVLFENHVRVGDTGGLVEGKYGFDAGDRPGGGCITLDALSDLRVAQSEIAGHKHLEAIGSVASLELDSAAGLQLQEVSGGQERTDIDVKGKLASLTYSSVNGIELNNNSDVADYKEHLEVANVNGIDHDEALRLSPANSQILAEYKEDLVITPIPGSQASIQLDEVVHFKVGDLEKTFHHRIREAAIQQVVEHFDDTL
jgi:hypothetical protein